MSKKRDPSRYSPYYVAITRRKEPERTFEFLEVLGQLYAHAGGGGYRDPRSLTELQRDIYAFHQILSCLDSKRAVRLMLFLRFYLNNVRFSSALTGQQDSDYLHLSDHLADIHS